MARYKIEEQIVEVPEKTRLELNVFEGETKEGTLMSTVLLDHKKLPDPIDIRIMPEVLDAIREGSCSHVTDCNDKCRGCIVDYLESLTEEVK